jgi:hypothetical protein
LGKKKPTPDEYDSPWKQALQVFLGDFLEFCFPDIAADIDWPRGYESLDKELHKIARRAKVGKRLADKLFKVWLKDGGERWLLIHIEVQGEYDADFERRMFQYNVAAYQMYNREVISLAALCDDRLDWRPMAFSYGRWGCKSEVIFRSTKLLDYADEVTRLEASENPFAVVVLTNIKAVETRNDPELRRAWKLRIIKGLLRRNWSHDWIHQFFQFIDYMMALPEELEKAIDFEVSQITEERTVEYVSGFERRLAERLTERLTEHVTERVTERVTAKALEQGREEGLLESIAMDLDVKFGAAGRKLMPKTRALTGLAQLRKFARFLKKADTLDEVRQYFD